MGKRYAENEVGTVMQWYILGRWDSHISVVIGLSTDRLGIIDASRTGHARGDSHSEIPHSCYHRIGGYVSNLKFFTVSAGVPLSQGGSSGVELPVVVASREVTLSIDVSSLCRLLQAEQGSVGVLLHAVSVQIHDAQSALRLQTAVTTRLWVPQERLRNINTHD